MSKQVVAEVIALIELGMIAPEDIVKCLRKANSEPEQALAAPVQDSTCSENLRAQGKAYPRTCKKCGLGPCIGAPKQPLAQPAQRPQNCGTSYCSCVECVMEPAVPDAFGTREGEHPEYIQGWNDCRAEMLKGRA
jgi:hypothetical protein